MRLISQYEADAHIDLPRGLAAFLLTCALFLAPALVAQASDGPSQPTDAPTPAAASTDDDDAFWESDDESWWEEDETDDGTWGEETEPWPWEEGGDEGAEEEPWEEGEGDGGDWNGEGEGSDWHGEGDGSDWDGEGDGSDWDGEGDGGDWDGEGDGSDWDGGETDISEPTGDDPLGYICYRDGREKEITPSAAIWMAKMVHGETGGNPSQDDAEAMLWTIVQRTDLPSFQSRTLEYLVRAYSQPINRRWLRDGRYCKKYYEDDFTGDIPDNCQEYRIRRREQYIANQWDDTAEVARRAVIDFVSGYITNPVIGSIGWFDSAVWRRGETNGNNSNRSFVAEVERNTFYARRRGPATMNWDEWDVSVVPADEFCPDFVGSAEMSAMPSPAAADSQSVETIEEVP